MPRQATAAWILLGLGLAAALVQLSQRVQIEGADRQVALVLDYDEVARLAAVTGGSTSEVLQQLCKSASHVAVSEQTWDDLHAVGAFQTWSGAVVPQGYVPSGYTVLHLGNWTKGRQIEAALRAKGIAVRDPQEADGSPLALMPAGRSLLVPTAMLKLTDLGLGYDAQAVEEVRRAGLGVVARPRPALVTSGAAVRGALGLAKDTGARIVVFLGNEVVGNPSVIPDTAEALREFGLKFGWLELSPQFGAEKLASRVSDLVVRTHSIGDLEMRVTLPGQALERYARAVRERGVRVLYVRLLVTADEGADLLATNLRYLDQVRATVQAEGFRLDDPAPTAPLEVNLVLRALMGAGIAGAVLLALSALGLAQLLGWPAVALLVLVFSGGAVGPNLARHFLALLGVVTGASLGLIALRPVEERRPAPLRAAVLRLLAVSAATVAIASLSVGLLSDRSHMVGTQLFRGVKLSLILPPLAVLLVQVARAARSYWELQVEAGGRREWAALMAGARETAEYAVKYWHVVLALALLSAAALMVVRSGNEPLFGPSGIEMRLRSMFEAAVGVRPRTKEFAVGHPLALLGLWLLYRRQKRATWLILSAGALGQASLANTFCHIHTPYLLSLWRGSLGLLCGLAIGIVLVAVWDAVEKRLARSLKAKQ